MSRIVRVRTTALVGSVAVALGLLSGCSQSPYCASVEESKATLDVFGSKRTDEAFADYARTMNSIAKQAPSSSKDAWTTLATVTQDVIDAHQEVGFKLEDMADEKKRDGLSDGDIEVLNEVYAAFNDTQAERKAVVADAKKTCDITLK